MIEVTYVNHMGDDLSVVNAARVSFGKKSDYMPRVHNGEAKVLQHKDDRLIKYLAKHNHKSPFNHTFTTFHVKAPVFVARQLVKHEYMPWNEISRRYVDNKPEFYQPEEWRGRSADKKQGSDGTVKSNANVPYFNDTMLGVYTQLLDEGVAPEQARMVLPQSMMTEWYWSGTLYAFAKMCGLRLKEDTQAETRVVAEKIEDVMAELYPVSWEALRMYEE
jgi:thymidylate synthase (FAD)